MDVRGGRRTADPRQAVAGSDEAGAAAQAAGRDAAADPSRVEAAEPQSAEAEAGRGDSTPRDRRGRTYAENAYSVAQVYAMGDSGDEAEVEPDDESRRLRDDEDEGEEDEALRGSGEDESQADWGADHSPPEAGAPGEPREEAPELTPDRPEEDVAAVGSIGPTAAESEAPSAPVPSVGANAPARPVHLFLGSPQLDMEQPEVFRRVASEFLMYPRSEPLTADQLYEALQVCPLVVCKAMVSCAPLFRSLDWSSERFRALVPSQDGPEQLRFPFVPTKWRPDWQGGKAGRFSMPLEWIEDRSFGHGLSLIHI